MTAPPKVDPAEEIVYPDDDGQPMSDNTRQFRYIVYIKEGHEVLYEDDPTVFVAGNLLWYPVEFHPEIRSAPDALLAFGRPKGDRGSYMQWREGNVAPQVVWEVLSPGNYPAQMQEKFDFYQFYGVEEYYQYDPDRGRLRGWIRNDGVLEEIEAIQGWVSPRTGVRMELVGNDLVLTGPHGKPFRTMAEHSREREAAERRAGEQEQRAELERQQRIAAEALAEEQRQRAEQESRQRAAAEALAEQEAQERAAAEGRAAQERQRAERLAARLRELGINPEEGS